MLELYNAMLSKLCTRCVIDTMDNCDTVCHCAPKILSFSFESQFFGLFVCLFSSSAVASSDLLIAARGYVHNLLVPECLFARFCSFASLSSSSSSLMLLRLYCYCERHDSFLQSTPTT